MSAHAAKARGGKREGAGRKSRSPEGNRVHITVRIDPATDATIRAHQRGDSYAATLDRIVREWLGVATGERGTDEP